MAHPNLPSACASSVVSHPTMRNTGPSRLPAYRLSHMLRFHPYARIVRCHEDHRTNALKTATAVPLGDGGRPRVSCAVVERTGRVDACEDAPDGGVHQCENELLPAVGRAADESDREGLVPHVHDGAGPTHAQSQAAAPPALVTAILDLIEFVRRRYFSLDALAEFLKLDALER
ncbi:hypothetical protein FKP32DRAFT_1600320 [Trametes sanguinea]|nr:hypothetical protein FKP32DRAFT_1600320 [Trametes sanguinea]